MSPEQFIRQTGYGFIRDRHSGKESYVRRLGGGFYPRLHMYIEDRGDAVSFNLHLDQKQASYEGSNMHSGEYDGEVVESEMERIKSFINVPAGPDDSGPDLKPSQPQARVSPEEGRDILGSLSGNRDYTKLKPREKEKSWWKRFFSS